MSTRHTGHWTPDKFDIEAEVNRCFAAGWHELTVHWDGRPVAAIYWADDGDRKVWIDKSGLAVTFATRLLHDDTRGSDMGEHGRLSAPVSAGQSPSSQVRGGLVDEPASKPGRD